MRKVRVRVEATDYMVEQAVVKALLDGSAMIVWEVSPVRSDTAKRFVHVPWCRPDARENDCWCRSA